MVFAPILWAQRSNEHVPAQNIVYLTIDVANLDPSSVKLEVTPTHLSFSGHPEVPAATGTAAKVEPKTYEVELDFFAEVEEVKRTLTGKHLALVLQKKEAQEDYWPRLTKEKVKLNYVKTDFSKWKDQDEQEDEEEQPEEPQGPPGGGMGGMPGMGGMGGMGGAGGMDFASMMQGMGGGGEGGMGGMDFEKMMAQMKASGMGGLGGEGGEGAEGAADLPEEEDSDDDGPPPLEAA